jgi:hypothetical protein
MVPKFQAFERVRISEEGDCKALVEQGRYRTGMVVSSGMTRDSETLCTIKMDDTQSDISCPSVAWNPCKKILA